jgi:hypothetical protein
VARSSSTRIDLCQAGTSQSPSSMAEFIVLVCPQLLTVTEVRNLFLHSGPPSINCSASTTFPPAVKRAAGLRSYPSKAGCLPASKWISPVNSINYAMVSPMLSAPLPLPNHGVALPALQPALQPLHPSGRPARSARPPKRYLFSHTHLRCPQLGGKPWQDD